MKKILHYLSLNTDIATLVLRLLFGGLFVYYGYQKLFLYNEYAPDFSDPLGLGSKASFTLVVFAEFVCGLLVTIGLLTRLSVIPIFITMMVAFFITHAEDAFQVKQLAFVFLILSIVIFILGSGRYSLDKLILRNDAK